MTVKQTESQPSISVSASATVAAGDPITVDGSGFAAGERVTVKLGTEQARSVTVTASEKGAGTHVDSGVR